MLVLGITGTLGAGKGTVVEELVNKYGFVHFSAREYICAEVRKLGLEVSRDTTTPVANALRAKYHPGIIVENLYNEAVKSGKNAIIESVRTLGEIETLKSKGPFYLIAIDADRFARYERIRARMSVTDNVSFEKFCEDEDREMESSDPNKQNLRVCMKEANFTIVNDESEEILRQKIAEIMEKIL